MKRPAQTDPGSAVPKAGTAKVRLAKPGAPPKPRAARPGLSISPARRLRLPDQIYEQVLQQIVYGQMAEGDKLPTEHQMSDLFQVSRPIVREALSRLQADGLVEAVQGSGTYVRRRPDPAVVTLAPRGQIADILRCFELRMALEGEAAFYAAQRRTIADVRAIGDAYETLEAVIKRGELGVNADIDFHGAVVRAAHNELFENVFNNLHALMEAGLTITRSMSSRKQSDRPRTVQSEHMALVTAIVDREPENARTAARIHVENSKIRLMSQENMVLPPASEEPVDEPPKAGPRRRQ